jgi:hypothetical protein
MLGVYVQSMTLDGISCVCAWPYCQMSECLPRLLGWRQLFLLEGVVPLRIVLVVQGWTCSWWRAAVGGRGVCPAAVLWGQGPIVWLQVSGVGAGGSWGVLERGYCAGPFQPVNYKYLKHSA